jgi:hypothetical protein
MTLLVRRPSPPSVPEEEEHDADEKKIPLTTEEADDDPDAVIQHVVYDTVAREKRVELMLQMLLSGDDDASQRMNYWYADYRDTCRKAGVLVVFFVVLWISMFAVLYAFILGDLHRLQNGIDALSSPSPSLVWNATGSP